jgi:Predicted nucleotide-binding protein containing TIR-like domain
MARGSTNSPPPKQPAKLTADEKRQAIELLRRRVDELRQFDVRSIETTTDPQISAMGNRIDTALVQIFGNDTVDYERYMWAASMRSAVRYIGRGLSLEAVRDEVEKERQRAITTLEEIITRFKEELELAPPNSADQIMASVGDKPRKAFVVHGHDEAARESVARFLERIGFEPIILHEQANQGRTVIEKIEAHGDVGFAIVLLTPDDEGRLKGGTSQPRPRQNVLLELGYL